jgi:type I restriction enzyme, S subunit
MMWEIKKLEEVSDISMGQSPPSSTYNKDGNGLPFFQGKKEFGKLHPKPEQWCNKPKKIAEKNDLLISVRAPVGDVNIANQKCCFGRGLAAIRFEGKLKYLFYFIQANKHELEKQGTGSTFKAISGKVLRSFPIPVPPLPTQHQIVEKIEELFSELDHGVESLKKAQQQLKTYRQAVLKDAFEGKLTKEWREQQMVGTPETDDPVRAIHELPLQDRGRQKDNMPQSGLPTPEELLEQIKAEREAHREHELAEWENEVEQWVKDGKMGRKPTKPAMSKNVDVLRKEEIKSLPKLPEKWSWIRLGNLSNDIQIGPFGSLLHKSEYIADGIPVINPSNIKDERISPDLNITISDEKFSELTKYKLKEGNVIIGRRGEMGRSALVTYKEDGWLCGTGSLFVKLNKYSNPSFITKYVRSKFFIDYLDNNARGTTMKNLNASILSNSPVPLLSREEQNEIVSEIESRLSVVNQLEQTINENLQKAEALRQSILKKAFNGRLIRN